MECIDLKNNLTISKIYLIPLNAGALGIKGQETAPSSIWKEIKNYEYSFYMRPNVLADMEPEEIKVNNSNIGESHELIFNSFLNYLNQVRACENKRKFVIALGGDHSITFPIFRSILELYPNSGLILFDAHPDLEPYPEIASHDSWLRKLIKEGLNPSNVLILGTRAIGKEEAKFIEENSIRTYNPFLLEKDTENISDIVMSTARKWEKVWISIDIDVFDPSFAPGTFYNEPLGITPLSFFYIFKRLLFLKNLLGFDIVEVNPCFDRRNTTSKLAASIILQTI